MSIRPFPSSLPGAGAIRKTLLQSSSRRSLMPLHSGCFRTSPPWTYQVQDHLSQHQSGTHPGRSGNNRCHAPGTRLLQQPSARLVPKRCQPRKGDFLYRSLLGQKQMGARTSPDKKPPPSKENDHSTVTLPKLYFNRYSRRDNSHGWRVSRWRFFVCAPMSSSMDAGDRIATRLF